MRQRIICLANSRKPGGHCIAGLTPAGKFVRLCGPGGVALTDSDTNLGSWDQPQVLDELDVLLKDHIPEGHQTENWLVDSRVTRVTARKASPAWSQRIAATREPSPIILGSAQSTIGAREAEALGRSLEIIRPRDLWVTMRWRPGLYLPQFRGDFLFRGIRYDLPITCPMLEREFRKNKAVLRDGVAWRWPLLPAGCVLHATVSIGEEYRDGLCYKLLAAVFPLPWWVLPAR